MAVVRLCHDGSVPGKPSRLRLDQLGPSEQAALRVLLDTFRDHGWKDTSNAALTAVRVLARSPSGVSPSGLAAAMPDRFYLQNDVTKKILAAVLADLAAS